MSGFLSAAAAGTTLTPRGPASSWALTGEQTVSSVGAAQNLSHKVKERRERGRERRKKGERKKGRERRKKGREGVLQDSC